MRRMRLLLESTTTIKLLEGITATPRGLQKLAAEPTPSANALLPLPPRVVTAPEVGSTSRTRLLSSSATTTMPLKGITATPRGLLKLAAAPMPSANAAAPLPASVMTAPELGSTSRMRLL
jgi:hypothetical protein